MKSTSFLQRILITALVCMSSSLFVVETADAGQCGSRKCAWSLEAEAKNNPYHMKQIGCEHFKDTDKGTCEGHFEYFGPNRPEKNLPVNPVARPCKWLAEKDIKCKADNKNTCTPGSTDTIPRSCQKPEYPY